MAGNRYARDYLLKESFETDGQIRTELEYIGLFYRYREGEKAAAGHARRASWLLSVCALLYPAALCLPSLALKRVWIWLPFLGSVVPFAQLSVVCHVIRTRKEPLERRHADKGNLLFPQSAFLLGIFSSLALAGEGVAAGTGGRMLEGDALFAFAALLLFTAACYLFSIRKFFLSVPETEGEKGS